MIKFFYIVVLTCVLLSCESKNETIPKNIISQNTMVQLIADIEITQGFIKVKNTAIDSIDTKALYHNNFKKYGVTKNQFNESLKYYSANPKQIEEIYKKVITQLSEKQAENMKNYQSAKKNDD